MYERVLDRLAAAGFEQYEISNWAAREENASFRCAHNLAYWRNLNWLALGPSASGHVDGYRWKNEAHLGRYIAGAPTPPRVDEERLPPERRVGETLMMGLRLREGVERAWLDAHLPPDDPRRTTIDELVSLGFLEHAADRLRLTRRGLFVADPVIAKLL
jgi:oxygen-independent coproporphyrinogen-3 oxidase